MPFLSPTFVAISQMFYQVPHMVIIYKQLLHVLSLQVNRFRTSVVVELQVNCVSRIKHMNMTPAGQKC